MLEMPPLAETREPNEVEKSPLWLNREMYRLPNDPPLTERDVARYVTSNEKFQARLPQMIEASLKSDDDEVRQSALKLGLQLPSTDHEQLIRRGLGDSSFGMRRIEVTCARCGGWNSSSPRRKTSVPASKS